MQRSIMQTGGSRQNNKVHGCLSSMEKETPLLMQQTQQQRRPKTHQREREKNNTEGYNQHQTCAAGFGKCTWQGARKQVDELGGQTCY